MTAKLYESYKAVCKAKGIKPTPKKVLERNTESAEETKSVSRYAQPMRGMR